MKLVVVVVWYVLNKMHRRIGMSMFASRRLLRDIMVLYTILGVQYRNWSNLCNTNARSTEQSL